MELFNNIKFYDVFRVTGGELFDLINSKGLFKEDEARDLVKQMIDTLVYLHGKGIAHRDLKFENILLKDKNYDKIKISDFGLSRIIKEGSFMQTICGTPEYIAPEVLKSKSTSGYGKAVDLWSLGVILYTMLVFDNNIYKYKNNIILKFK